VVAVQWLERHQAAQLACRALRLFDAAHGDAFRYRYASFLQQCLGQLFIACDFNRDMAGVAGNGRLQAFLLCAPA